MTKHYYPDTKCVTDTRINNETLNCVMWTSVVLCVLCRRVLCCVSCVDECCVVYPV